MEDWDNLFNFDFDLDLDLDGPSVNNQSPLSVDDIEQLLFKDDDDDYEVPPPTDDGFLDEILLDSPQQGEKSGEVVDHNEEKYDDDDDPIAKKRKRQLRNKDAALRSRERKKMHVKDLEMKSKYYEGECKRLGSLLQWYMAENQSLRFTLHNNASITKQESAVLFLESLLLGSLLWLMGLVLVFLLPTLQSLSLLVEGKHLPSLSPRNKGGGSSKALFIGKRFKASRSRMRQRLTGFLILCYFPF